MQLFRHDPIKFSNASPSSIRHPACILKQNGDTYTLIDILPSHPNRSRYFPICIGNKFNVLAISSSDLVPYIPISFKEL